MSDRSLRRLVAELASASSEDICGVLDLLPREAQQTVRGLLLDFKAKAPGGAGLAAATDPAPAPLGAQMSPWLTGRLAAAGATDRRGEAQSFAMTPLTQAALLACAAEAGLSLSTLASAPEPLSPQAKGRGTSRLQTLLMRGRGAP